MLWLFVISLGVFLLCLLAMHLQSRWLALPHFVRNNVGGITAWCSVTDFNRGVRRGNFVLVPETIACSTRPCPVPGRFVRGEDVGFRFIAWRDDERLFVPFASEGHMSYGEQVKFFRFPPLDADAFLNAKVRENIAADWRMRFVELVGKNVNAFLWAFFSSAVALIAIAIIGGLGVMTSIEEKWDNAPAVFYATTAGSSEVLEHHGSRKDLSRLPMTSSEMLDVIRTGPISTIMPIGGGLEYVCLMRLGGRRNCGFAPTGLKNGDTVYMRLGDGKQWMDEHDYGYSETVFWVITEQEAKVLLLKGFKLEK